MHTHIYTLSPPPPSRRCDSFVTKMNSSSALQPKQVIWLPRPQIKLVWFNFRFGLLLQPYIKGDIFHYTAKPQAGRQRWPTPSIGRHHGSIMAFTRYCCGSSKASGGFGAIGGLVINTALCCTASIFSLFRSLPARLWQCVGRSGCIRDHMGLLQISISPEECANQCHRQATVSPLAGIPEPKPQEGIKTCSLRLQSHSKP